jgi:hypothetical protein
MPQIKSWESLFKRTVNEISSNYEHIPEDLDFSELRRIEDRINDIWRSEDGKWEDFKDACNDYRKFWMGYTN